MIVEAVRRCIEWWHVACPACDRGAERIIAIPCSQIPQVSCDHFTHYDVHRCRWCRGGERVDRITAWLLRRRE